MRQHARHGPTHAGNDLESRADALFLAFSLGLLTLTLVLSIAFLV